MYAASKISPPPARAQATPDADVRRSVAELLTRSEAFRAMSPADQMDIARNTALIADYLARPEGIDGRKLIDRPPGTSQALAGEDKSAAEASWEERKAAVDDIGQGGFKAKAAREAAAVAGELLNQVKFPTFVSGLIQGVFQSITDSSIQQMEAYQKMVAAVATSLKQFMDDHVSENQGRDHMVEQFPDLFEIGFDDSAETPGPRLQLREGVDESEALKKVNNKLEFQDGQIKSLDLSDENAERALIEQSRMQLARQRQQLMASIVLMGINRIVVTDGKISAKIIYDVKAQDSYAMRRSASAVDLARDRYGNVQTTYAGEGKYDRGGDVSSSRSKDSREYDANYFAKGEYKYENKPIITAQTAASEASNAAMQTKIQLSGAVDVNFKSDYLPLDKMATPQMIAAIQGNATPADPNVVPSAKSAPAAAPAAVPAAPAAPAV